MAEWKDGLDTTTALLNEWNSSGGGVIRGPARQIDPQYVPALCFLLLVVKLTDNQRALFKELLMSPTLSDAERLTRLGQLRSVLLDVEVEGGLIAPAELQALPGKLWRGYTQSRFR